MATTHREHQTVAQRAPGFGRPPKLALLTVALIGGYYLLGERWNQAARHWVFLLLLAYPLMHLFHGGGGHDALGQGWSAAGPRCNHEG